jgi:hypothetical protein
VRESVIMIDACRTVGRFWHTMHLLRAEVPESGAQGFARCDVARQGGAGV